VHVPAGSVMREFAHSAFLLTSNGSCFIISVEYQQEI
jgi:hypothetical protein